MVLGLDRLWIGLGRWFGQLIGNVSLSYLSFRDHWFSSVFCSIPHATHGIALHPTPFQISTTTPTITSTTATTTTIPQDVPKAHHSALEIGGDRHINARDGEHDRGE